MKARFKMTHILCCIANNNAIMFVNTDKPNGVTRRVKIRVCGKISFISFEEYANNIDKYKRFRVYGY